MSALKKLENKYVSKDGQNNRIDRKRLVTNQSISSDATGRINTVLSMDPVGSAEWTSMSALYDEFRVLGARVRIISKQQYSAVNLTDMAVVVFDNDDTGVLTSLDAGTQYPECKVFNAVFGSVTTTRENTDGALVYSFMRPNSGKNTSINWIDVANSNQSLGSIKFFVTNLSGTTSYWVILLEWFCEFRGRR